MAPSATTNYERQSREMDITDYRIHRIDAVEPDSVAMLLRNGETFIPSIISRKTLQTDAFSQAQCLTPESLVRIEGYREYSLEKEADVLHVTKLSVLAVAKAGVPKTILSHGAPGEEKDDVYAMMPAVVQQRFDNRVLDARVAASAAVTKLFSAVFELAVEQLAALDFCRIPTPTLIGWEFPGDEHEQFALNYFERETAWLAQTGDVHLEMALAGDLERVYDVHTVFRREENVTARHMTEFTTLEIMWAIKRDWTEIMEFSERFIISMTNALRKREKYSNLTRTASRLYPTAGEFKLGLDSDGRILRLKFSDAKQILRELGHQTEELVDITKQEEAILGKYLSSDASKVGPPTDIFFLTHFPRSARPYNVFASHDNDIDTHSVDIIMRGQEISTGYQCIHDYKEIRHAMATRTPPIDAESTAWKPFVEAHDVGMPPLGGVAIGLNRFLQGYLGAADIRETVLFPRDANRLRP